MPDINYKLIEHLAEKKLLGTISEEEQLLLDEWLNRIPEDTLRLTNAAELALGNRLLQKIKKEAGIYPATTELYPARSPWRKWAAAAAILIIIAGGYFFFSDEKETTKPLVEKTNDTDIKAPVTNLATITLANGQTVYINDNNKGLLATQGNVKLVKDSDGRIYYENNIKGEAADLVYNTLNNPRGSRLAWLTLADGTKVWLNAGSSLTYPVAFLGNERKVAITGEAYFEVAHNKEQPFIVSKGNTQVKVLGTQFNVNAYDDEADIKVTLLEGSVQMLVNKDGAGNIIESKTLVPGEQAILNNAALIAASNKNLISLTRQIDISEVMAWKNGEFRFKNTPVAYLLRQAARWYNVEFNYTSGIADITLSGVITRQENISKLLEIIAATKQVKFAIEGKKIIVSSYKK
ncbi:MAG: FecR domain-containing protein [Chitinophagaceae bacterium]